MGERDTHLKLYLAMGFRDTQLFDIVKKTYEIFQGILNKTLLFDKRKLYAKCMYLDIKVFFLSADQENRTKDVTLDLLNKCLSYDFAGISVDESGEDTGTIQVKKNSCSHHLFLSRNIYRSLRIGNVYTRSTNSCLHFSKLTMHFHLHQQVKSWTVSS